MIRKTRLEKIQLEKERVKDELTALGKEEIKKALLEASKDPLFLADIKKIEKDFAHCSQSFR